MIKSGQSFPTAYSAKAMLMVLVGAQFLTVSSGSFILAYYFLHIENMLSGREFEDHLFALFINIYTSISLAFLSFIFAFPCTAMFFFISQRLIKNRSQSLFYWATAGFVVGAVVPFVFLLWPLAIIFGCFGGIIGLLMRCYALKLYKVDQNGLIEKGVTP